MFLSSLGGVRNIKGFVKTSKPSKRALGRGGFKAHKQVSFKALRVLRVQTVPAKFDITVPVGQNVCLT